MNSINTSILTLLLLIAVEGFGQSNDKGTLFSVNYSYGLPMGSLNESVSNGSPRGFGVELSWKIAEKWRLGPSFGYQDYYQKNGRELLKPNATTDISAVVSTSIQPYTFMATTTFLPLADRTTKLQPFFQAGAGGAMIAYRQLWGMFDVANTNAFTFAAAAGAGLQYQIGDAKKMSLFGSALYNFIPYNRSDLTTINSIRIQAGIRIKLENNNSGYYEQTPDPRYYQNNNYRYLP